MSDEERDDSAEEAAPADKQPAEMNGFTILQILAWTNAEIARCREKLEVEPSGRVVAYLQGKIPGCKFAIKTIRDVFGLTNEQFDAIEQPADFQNLSMEQILGAEIDMGQLKEMEAWGAFLSAIQTRTEELKDFLLKRAKKSRELDEYQGEYQGMMYFEKVFGAITDQVHFWKNSLFKKEKKDGEMRDANDPLALPPPDDEMTPALPPPDDECPPDEDYDDEDEREPDEPLNDGDAVNDGNDPNVEVDNSDNA